MVTATAYVVAVLELIIFITLGGRCVAMSKINAT